MEFAKTVFIFARSKVSRLQLGSQGEGRAERGGSKNGP